MRKAKPRLSPEEKKLMQILWQLEEATVEELVEAHPDPRPDAYALFVMLRKLDKNGVVSVKKEGETSFYYPTRELTKAEEQIMQILWKLKRALVKDIERELPEPKPSINTISTIVRILEDKGFVWHKAYGKTHEYFPIVQKSQYSNSFLKNFMSKYFGGSFEQMVSFFVKQNDMDLKEFETLIKHLENDMKENKE